MTKNYQMGMLRIRMTLWMSRITFTIVLMMSFSARALECDLLLAGDALSFSGRTFSRFGIATANTRGTLGLDLDSLHFLAAKFYKKTPSGAYIVKNPHQISLIMATFVYHFRTEAYRTPELNPLGIKLRHQLAAFDNYPHSPEPRQALLSIVAAARELYGHEAAVDHLLNLFAKPKFFDFAQLALSDFLVHEPETLAKIVKSPWFQTANQLRNKTLNLSANFAVIAGGSTSGLLIVGLIMYAFNPTYLTEDENEEYRKQFRFYDPRTYFYVVKSRAR